LLAALACGAAWAAWKLRERHNAAARAGLELEVRERTTELSAANQQLRQEITERELADRETERLEGELLQAKRLESIGRLAGGVAHDFNNLLTVINGHCDVMLSRLGAIDPLRDSIHEVRDAGERAAELTRRLLAFSRKQILQPAPVSPGEIVSGIEGMLRRLLRSDIELITQFQPEAGQVMADRGQIESVLINLVVNARDAIAGPGRIMIVVREVEVAGGQPAGRDLKPGRYVRIAVSDTGHGMDEKTLQDVFEPFFTTKEVGKGTGLGLAMVHGVIKQSGGAIAVQSLPGKGTTFEILLPRLEGLGPAAMAHSPETPSTGGAGDGSAGGRPGSSAPADGIPADAGRLRCHGGGQWNGGAGPTGEIRPAGGSAGDRRGHAAHDRSRIGQTCARTVAVDLRALHLRLCSREYCAR
jgi:signal transduction histidine kinase